MAVPQVGGPQDGEGAIGLHPLDCPDCEDESGPTNVCPICHRPYDDRHVYFVEHNLAFCQEDEDDE